MRYMRPTLLLALLAGCSHDSNAPATIDGTYQLRGYNDQPLPGTVTETADSYLHVTEGTITVNGDLTFHDSYTFHQYVSGTTDSWVLSCTGHWAFGDESPQGGRYLTLHEDPTPGCGDSSIAAEWDQHNRLTIVWGHLGSTQHRR